MRLRDVRLAILTGLAGILHSTAQALLRQAEAAQAGADQKPAGEKTAVRPGGPPQHWLERVKEARVWYGTGPAQKSTLPGQPPPTPEVTTPEDMQGDAPRAAGQKDSPPMDEQDTVPTEPKATKPAPGSPPPKTETSAGDTKTGEHPRLEKPAAAPPAKARFRLRPPGSLKAKLDDPHPPEERTGTAQNPPAPSTADTQQGQPPRAAAAADEPDPAAPTFAAAQVKPPERDDKPPTHERASAVMPEQALHPPSGPPPPYASLRFESLRPALQWTRKTERDPGEVEPVPEGRAAVFPSLDLAAAPARPERTPGTDASGTPSGQAEMPANLSPQTRELAERAAPQQQTRWTQTSGRWLDLPADPTAERDLEAEREAREADLREQRHEQKLAREQRGDLWSA